MTAPDPTKPWAGYIQDQQYTAFQDRMIQIGKVNHQATVSGLNTRNGVFLGGGDGTSNINLNVRSGGGMNILIDAGSAIIDGYSVINPIQQAMTVDPATSTARRDAVILRVYDTEAGDATSKAVLEITKGTTTSDPPLPARSLLLSVIDVAANATSVTPTDRRNFTTSVGGVVPYYDPRVPTITDIANGQIIHSLNSTLNYQRDGDSFHPMGANLVGSWNYSKTGSEDVPLNVFAFKQWNITPSRQCNIVVVYAMVVFHQQNQGASSVIEWGLGFDAGDIASYVINTGSGHPYNVDATHTLLGAVANVSPGTHTITMHIKPTVGDGIELQQWYGWAIGIS